MSIKKNWLIVFIYLFIYSFGPLRNFGWYYYEMMTVWIYLLIYLLYWHMLTSLLVRAWWINLAFFGNGDLTGSRCDIGWSVFGIEWDALENLHSPQALLRWMRACSWDRYWRLGVVALHPTRQGLNKISWSNIVRRGLFRSRLNHRLVF